MMLKSRRKVVALALIALALFTIGTLCALLPRSASLGGSPEPPRIPLRILSIKALDVTPSDLPFAGAASTEELVDAAQKGLLQAGVDVALGAEPRDQGDYHLQLEIRLEHVEPSTDTDGKGILRALAKGRLQTRGHKPSSPQEPHDPKAPLPFPEIRRFDQEALAEKIYTGPSPPPKPTWAEHSKRTLLDTALALGGQLSMLALPRASLHSALSRKDLDTDLLGVAIRLSAARKDKEAVPALVELLRHGEMEIRDKAIGALVEIDDRRAVKALCASAQFQDTFELGKILEAVATLGGDEAQSYLEFVASGHQNPDIRKEAQRALLHLKARATRTSDGTPQKVPISEDAEAP